MSINIEDGRGTGKVLGVSDQHEVLVHGRTVSHPTHSSIVDGTAYCIHTNGSVALTTTASFSGLWYVYNDGASPIYIWQIRVGSDSAFEWEIYKNPTTGTLISAGTDVTPPQLNFASAMTLSATTKYGADGSTITDGTLLTHGISGAGESTINIDGAMVLTTGKSIAMQVKPSAAGDVAICALVTQENITF